MAATIKDIAGKTGLGLATISSYLNGGNVREKNRIKIEEAIRELHFEVNEVARGLKTNRTKIIGIVIPEFNSIFCGEIITEVEDILRSHGYAAIICDCRTNEKREEEVVEFLKKRRVDGLIIMPSGHHGTYVNAFAESGVPVVLIDRKLKGLDCDCVLVDNRGAAADAVERLVEAGHRKIGIIAGPVEVYTAQERLAGYRNALLEANLTPTERLISCGDFTITGGAQCMKKLAKQNPDMTAVFVSNYEMTMGAIIEANELGIKIGAQLSVIGFDNVDFARACVPKLSVVTQPTKKIAYHVAELLLARMELVSGEAGKTIKLKTGFVEGNSVFRRVKQ